MAAWDRDRHHACEDAGSILHLCKTLSVRGKPLNS
jgi:hypothetical protein